MSIPPPSPSSPERVNTPEEPRQAEGAGDSTRPISSSHGDENISEAANGKSAVQKTSLKDKPVSQIPKSVFDDLDIETKSKSTDFEGENIELSSIDSDFSQIETKLHELSVFGTDETLDTYIDKNFEDISSSDKKRIKRAMAATILSIGKNAKSINKNRISTLIYRAGIMAKNNPNLTHIRITSGHPPKDSKPISETYKTILDKQKSTLSDTQFEKFKDALSIIGTIIDPINPEQKTILIDTINLLEIDSRDFTPDITAQDMSKKLALKLQAAKEQKTPKTSAQQSEPTQEVSQQIKLTNDAIDNFFTQTRGLKFPHDTSKTAKNQQQTPIADLSSDIPITNSKNKSAEQQAVNSLIDEINTNINIDIQSLVDSDENRGIMSKAKDECNEKFNQLLEIRQNLMNSDGNLKSLSDQDLMNHINNKLLELHNKFRSDLETAPSEDSRNNSQKIIIECKYEMAEYIKAILNLDKNPVNHA